MRKCERKSVGKKKKEPIKETKNREQSAPACFCGCAQEPRCHAHHHQSGIGVAWWLSRGGWQLSYLSRVFRSKVKAFHQVARPASSRRCNHLTAASDGTILCCNEDVFRSRARARRPRHAAVSVAVSLQYAKCIIHQVEVNRLDVRHCQYWLRSRTARHCVVAW